MRQLFLVCALGFVGPACVLPEEEFESGESFLESEGFWLPGTYAGYMRMDGARHKIPLQLEALIPPEYEEGEHRKVIFLLKESVGGFTSHVYFMNYYERTHFDFESPELALPSNRKNHRAELAIADGHAEHVQVAGVPTVKITGRVQPLSLEEGSGEFQLIYIDRYRTPDQLNAQLDQIYPNHPIVPELTGSYLAVAQGREKACVNPVSLQMETTRVRARNPQDDSTLDGYSVRARFSTFPDLVPELDITGPDEKRMKRADWNKQYSFATTRILHSERAALRYAYYDAVPRLILDNKESCRVSNDPRHIAATTIQCQRCTFRRSDDEKSQKFFATMVGRQVPHWRVQRRVDYGGQPTISPESKVDDVKADFYGTIIDDQTGLEWAFSVLVNLSGRPDGKAALGGKTIDFLARRHTAAPLDDGLEFRVQTYPMSGFQLRGDAKNVIVESEGDGLLQIENWTRDTMTGVVYTKSTGRFGRFIVHRERDGQKDEKFLANRSRLLDRVEGVYSVYAPFAGTGLYFELALETSTQSSDDGNVLGYDLGGVLTTAHPDNEGDWYFGPGADPLISVRYDPTTRVIGFDTRGGRTGLGVFVQGTLWLHIAADDVTSVTRQNHYPMPFVRGKRPELALVDPVEGDKLKQLRLRAQVERDRWVKRMLDGPSRTKRPGERIDTSDLIAPDLGGGPRQFVPPMADPPLIRPIWKWPAP